MSDYRDTLKEAYEKGILLDSCGLIDRYYTTGLYTDLCGMSPEDAKNATIFPSGSTPTPVPPSSETPTNVITVTLDNLGEGLGFELVADPEYPPLKSVYLSFTIDGEIYSAVLPPNTTETLRTGFFFDTDEVTFGETKITTDDDTYKYKVKIVGGGDPGTNSVYYGTHRQKYINDITSDDLRAMKLEIINEGSFDAKFIVKKTTDPVSAMTDDEWEAWARENEQCLVFAVEEGMQFIVKGPIGDDQTIYFKNTGVTQEVDGKTYTIYAKYSEDWAFVPSEFEDVEHDFTFVLI